MTRRAFVWTAAKTIGGILLMIPLCLLMLLVMTPFIYTFALTLVARVLVGSLVYILYPKWGQAILPGTDFGDTWVGRPLDWFDKVLPF